MPPTTVVNDHIVIEYSQFQLQDSAGFHQAGALDVDATSPWRVVAGRGGARFHSDSNDRDVPVRLEAWDVEPDKPDTSWQTVAQGIIEPDSAEIGLRQVTGEPTEQQLTLVKTGPHHIRASLRTTLDTDNEEEYETDIQEEWLIQLWPVD
ncbi:hypothetical protein KIPE111705_20530 [Kibdelosporangium persicum]|uniref:Uncharacterized protein n=1 Tax=Kibdelosporangium persicum TaxID=2698649 RepID=A0ABX2FFA5_9PSEU|nr:hypothetical protein [Kibdelosporangium persicum]NRN70060.1 hypothetical protein [Kibdelosporangium persicum]